MTARSIAILALAVGCNMGGRSASVGSPSSQTSPPRTTAAAASFTQVTFERGPCFGTCPVYSVRVAGDGAVAFTGTRNTDSTRGSARLTSAQLSELSRLFDDHGFFALDSQYVQGSRGCGMYAADAPTVITSVTTATRTKRVKHDIGCSDAPAALGRLETRIEQLVDVSRWIGRR